MLIYYGVRSVDKQITKVRQDFYYYDESNTDPNVVFEANYFSCYYGAPVIKLPMDIGSASFGVILLSPSHMNEDILNHEYGHIIQLREKKLVRYLFEVAIPSFFCATLTTFHVMTQEQYNALPFESEATQLGNLNAICAP